MKQLIEFDSETGITILVEVDEPEPDNVIHAGQPSEVVRKATQTFETALDAIKPIATVIVTKLRSLSDPPREMEVEFGLKLHAEVGVVLALVGAEAHYKVTLKWPQG
jgi:hypothetical protein